MIQIKDEDVLPLLFANESHFMLRSVRTGTEYSYKLKLWLYKGRRPTEFRFWCYDVFLDDGTRAGYLKMDFRGRKFEYFEIEKDRGDIRVNGLLWTLRYLLEGGNIPGQVEVYNLSDKCSRCGRPLSDEVSISRGLGPTCHKIGLGEVFTTRDDLFYNKNIGLKV